MTTPPVQTESLCPHCLRRVKAFRVHIDDCVYLDKTCPEHGHLEKVLLWKEYPWPYESWNRSGPERNTAFRNGSDSPDTEGCPRECGICRHHEQATCTAIVEVTHDCNLGCAFCFAASQAGPGAGPDLKQIEEMLETVKDTRGICPVQLSGGEPTLRDDLPEIVAIARKKGFDHIQINTNGIRMAQDAEYARSLTEAGTTDFFLQFDGLSNRVYSRIRGADLLPIKLKAVERCAELKTGVILVPTLVRNINENQIGRIIQFAKEWIPTVKGVHFQPMTYLGRYPDSPCNEDRILIPDLLMAIEEQTAGELIVENMVPPG